ncbi:MULTISPECIES: DMT family transporter [Mycolicibacterium]|uniref:Multidrug efflux SMR transporter n=1 Tax=Mycolicibacterium austroafricanum TaxID=39687 RepID=A0ABT8HI80_MYCAO|nr:multidrug efflux SMR transporter [Mycolicibacterium austroafricanum]MDN4520461.1 multidrug efflux SMR transporter [Mycolicibacterium austroafricanum]PQP44171.1 QacE family quaternary ammonium compound efflux SMR transporter [Mycolicibacterium austroafricanum]QRZ07667.1 multidrug efflux SMR transporter [Mycolicibacterium austroafricanum]QZT69330.1 multidrug efflux SMR transporter [Mycolicibacterium austroafricanum]QZY47119.1 multidrug efflux SMR transporter [Mycolicibacterium austroafricanum
MAWFVLIVSAVLEAVWATALGRADGFTAPGPTVVFLVAMLASLGGLGWATKHIPIGTAYAVWTGLGAALTVGYAMLSGDEHASLGKAVFLTGIIATVVGLKLLPPAADPVAGSDAAAAPVPARSGR